MACPLPWISPFFRYNRRYLAVYYQICSWASQHHEPFLKAFVGSLHFWWAFREGIFSPVAFPGTEDILAVTQQYFAMKPSYLRLVGDPSSDAAHFSFVSLLDHLSGRGQHFAITNQPWTKMQAFHVIKMIYNFVYAARQLGDDIAFGGNDLVMVHPVVDVAGRQVAKPVHSLVWRYNHHMKLILLSAVVLPIKRVQVASSHRDSSNPQYGSLAGACVYQLCQV